MFYIQAKDSVHVKLAKPLAIDIPTEEVDPEMKLFTGQKTASGKIDWQNPVPLKKETLQSGQVSEGEGLFNKNCKSCHRLGENAVSPDLSYIGQRRDFDWLVRYIQNSSGMIASACGNEKSATKKMYDFETGNEQKTEWDYAAPAAAKATVLMLTINVQCHRLISVKMKSLPSVNIVRRKVNT
jgi:cytochrome c2